MTKVFIFNVSLCCLLFDSVSKGRQDLYHFFFNVSGLLWSLLSLVIVTSALTFVTLWGCKHRRMQDLEYFFFV